MIQIPKFREIYFNEVETKDGVEQVKTVCELESLEDHDLFGKKGSKMSFGISRTRADKYNETLGKKVSYAMAVRFMFLRVSGDKNVEDRTSFRRPAQTA